MTLAIDIHVVRSTGLTRVVRGCNPAMIAIICSIKQVQTLEAQSRVSRKASSVTVLVALLMACSDGSSAVGDRIARHSSAAETALNVATTWAASHLNVGLERNPRN